MAKKFWFELEFLDGDKEYDTNSGYGYDSEEEAEDAALEWISNYHAGNEVLNLSNPGDWSLDEDSPEFTVFEDEEDVIRDFYDGSPNVT